MILKIDNLNKKIGYKVNQSSYFLYKFLKI